MAELTYFGRKCAEIRKRLNITQAEVAAEIGYSQEYLSKLENGQKPLTIALLKKYLSAFAELGKKEPTQWGENPGLFPLNEQLEFTCELFERSGKIEINLPDISIIHRNSITKLMAILVVDEFFPMDVLDGSFIPWLRVNEVVKILQEDPNQYRPDPFALEHRFDGFYKNKK